MANVAREMHELLTESMDAKAQAAMVKKLRKLAGEVKRPPSPADSITSAIGFLRDAGSTKGVDSHIHVRDQLMRATHLLKEQDDRALARKVEACMKEMAAWKV